MIKFVFTIFVCLVISNNGIWGVVGIEEDINTNDSQDIIKNNKSMVGSDQFNQTFLSLDKGQKLLKEKCMKNSELNNSYELIVNAKEDFEVCVESLININGFVTEINEARPKGEVDIVFKKYCKKFPEFENCLLNFTTSINDCLDKDEKYSKINLLSASLALLSYICEDEGSQIALFYSNAGPDCLMDRKEAIQYCFNKSFSRYSSSGGKPSWSSLLALKFEIEHCKNIADLELCVVTELKKCDEQTPAYIIKSLFEVIYGWPICSKLKVGKIQVSTGITFQSTILLSALGGVILLLGNIG